MKAVKIAKSLFVIAVLITFAMIPAINAAPGASGNDVNSALAQVRQATVKYHDVTLAEADGYVSTEECVEVPGLGGMGIHYVNFILAGDQAVDPLRPEVLLYVATEQGFRLVAVEYLLIALANTPEGPAPWFEPDPADERPMPGHEPEQPWHYDFHVWLWQANPNGIFEDFNPNISCPSE
jgi:hypothetical protein